MSNKECHRDELRMKDGGKSIILSLEKPYTKCSSDLGSNIIEISYREEDEDGWGFGGDEYCSTYDIKNMANGIRSVIHHKANAFQYSCQDDIFRLKIRYEIRSELFSFSVALLETLHREYHIEITKENLTLSALDRYIQPFFEWEKQYPIE